MVKYSLIFSYSGRDPCVPSQFCHNEVISSQGNRCNTSIICNISSVRWIYVPHWKSSFMNRNLSTLFNEIFLVFMVLWQLYAPWAYLLRNRVFGCINICHNCVFERFFIRLYFCCKMKCQHVKSNNTVTKRSAVISALLYKNYGRVKVKTWFCEPGAVKVSKHSTKSYEIVRAFIHKVLSFLLYINVGSTNVTYYTIYIIRRYIAFVCLSINLKNNLRVSDA